MMCTTKLPEPAWKMPRKFSADYIIVISTLNNISTGYAMGACCSKNTIDDKIVTIEKQPWSVVQKTLGTGDLLFLSGFEWVPQVTGRKKFFDEEHERWTYVGFVYLKGDTPYLIDLSFKDSKLRNLNGDFKSGEVKMVKAEDRVFRRSAVAKTCITKVQQLGICECTSRVKRTNRRSKNLLEVCLAM